LEKRFGYILVVAVVVCIAAAYYLLNPANAVANTLQTAEVNDLALHRAELSDTIFIYYIPLTNPTRTPVTVDSCEITLLVNGTDYASMVMQNNPATVNPGTTVTLNKLVHLTGSPIGYQGLGQKKYTLEATVKILASADSLGMSASQSLTLTDQRSWIYSKLGP
jgi:hypothetical protein